MVRYAHWSHANGVASSCVSECLDRVCVISAFDHLVANEQCLHAYGRDSLCTRWCSDRLPPLAKRASHVEHTNGRSSALAAASAAPAMPVMDITAAAAAEETEAAAAAAADEPAAADAATPFSDFNVRARFALPPLAPAAAVAVAVAALDSDSIPDKDEDEEEDDEDDEDEDEGGDDMFAIADRAMAAAEEMASMLVANASDVFLACFDLADEDDAATTAAAALAGSAEESAADDNAADCCFLEAVAPFLPLVADDAVDDAVADAVAGAAPGSAPLCRCCLAAGASAFASLSAAAARLDLVAFVIFRD